MDLADETEGVEAAPELSLARRAPRRGVGRPPNRVLEQVLAYAARKRISDAALARALADVEFVPAGPGPSSPEVSLAERWAAIIKSARARRRRAARSR